jgi:hypothetical protein
MFPTVTLSNGLKIANFSSLHPFAFETGEVLAGCTPEHSRQAMLKMNEYEWESPEQEWTDVIYSFTFTQELHELLVEAHKLDVDIVLVPLAILNAVKENGEYLRRYNKIRGCIGSERVMQAISSTRFAI